MSQNSHQILYTSSAIEIRGGVDTLEIVREAARRNALADITGFLMCADGRFLQFVEGPEIALKRLMAKIEQDWRHEGIVRWRDEPGDARLYPDWRMKRLRVSDAVQLIGNPNAEIANFRIAPELQVYIAQFLNELGREPEAIAGQEIRILRAPTARPSSPTPC